MPKSCGLQAAREASRARASRTGRVKFKPVLERATLRIVAPPDLENQRKEVSIMRKERNRRIPTQKTVTEASLQKIAKGVARLPRKAVEMIFTALARELAYEEAAARCSSRNYRNGKAKLLIVNAQSELQVLRPGGFHARIASR